MRHSARRRALVIAGSTVIAGFALVAPAYAATSGPSATTAVTGAPHTASGATLQPGGIAQHVVRPSTALSGGRNASSTSTNWSGYAATGSTYTSVASSWTEPTGTCKSGDQYSSFWVGLDGYNSNSVEQTGTDSDCSGGSPDYYGWYEMYPADPVYFTNPVAPGDSLSASVAVSGTSYTLTLTDSTQGWTQTENESGSYADSSAEVITEAPSSAQGPLPLADFGTIGYSASAANGASFSAQDPMSITMVAGTGDQLDSTSALDGSGGFSNTWQAAS